MSKSKVIVSPIDQKQQKIRQYFKNPFSPNYFITYSQFFKHFHINDSVYKTQNLNIIDTHLRYRWFVRQKMASYKWISIICITPLLYHNFWFILIIPYFTVSMFDHYFQNFFIWRYKNKKIINIRNEFITKLSKQKYKDRRIKLFNQIYDSLERKDQITQENKILEMPLKYIKFGQFTEYIFHAEIDNKQQSSILQTTIFQTFLYIKDFIFGFNKLSILKDIFIDFKNDFWEYKKDDNRTKYSIDTSILLDRPDIKIIQQYTVEDNIDHNIRRFSQLWGYYIKKNIEPSYFKLWQYTNFSKYQDIFDPIKYNIKDNQSDLLIYYSILAIPKLFKIIFKRR